MKNIFFSLLIINSSFVFSIEASNILYKTIERFKGIDRYLLVEINEKKNNGKHKNRIFESWTHWDSLGTKKERVLMFKPDNLKGVNFWSHTKNGVTDKWMTLPKIGKLKKVKGRFGKKDDFDFSELELKEDNIEGHVNSIIGEEMVNDRFCYVITNIKKNKNGEIKSTRKIWVDKNDYIIHKVVYFNKKNKITKEIFLTNLTSVNNNYVFKEIKINDIKKKKNILIKFSNISFDKIIDLEMLEPKSLN